jgi:hypothetical protein
MAISQHKPRPCDAAVLPAALIPGKHGVSARRSVPATARGSDEFAAEGTSAMMTE